LGAELTSGVGVFLEMSGFDEKLRGADLVLTGEGRLDAQTAFGKAPMGVARAARRQGVPTVALAGSLGPGADTLLAQGFSAVFSIAPGPISLEASIGETANLLKSRAESIARLFALGKK